MIAVAVGVALWVRSRRKQKGVALEHNAEEVIPLHATRPSSPNEYHSETINGLSPRKGRANVRMEGAIFEVGDSDVEEDVHRT